MLKKQKVKILSIVGATIVGAGITITTPIAIALNQKEISSSNNSLSIQNAKATTGSTTSEIDKKNYWVVTGLAITYGVIALIIACVAFAYLYKNRKAKKKQNEAHKRIDENLLNDQVGISSNVITEEEIENVNKIDTFLKDKETENYNELKKVIKSYLSKNVIVDYDDPVEVRKYFDNKKESYLPNIVYLKATPEHNLLFNGKNILSVEKPFDNDKNDILVYDLWSNKITGYAKVVEVVQTNKNGLYSIIKEFSAFAEKDFNDLYKDSKNACLLFCDNIVRFENPIDPESIGIESLAQHEEEETFEKVVVFQQAPVVEEVISIEQNIIDNVEVLEEEVIIEDEPMVIEEEPTIIDEVIVEEEPMAIEEEIIVEENVSNDDFTNNELAKQTSKIEPVISNDVEIVKPVAKNEIEDIIKANEQTPNEIIREDNEIENKIIYPKFKIKTIIDKQTRKNAPITFLVTKQEKNNISNTYEINNKNNKRNKEQKIAKEYTYNKRKISSVETEMLKKEGKFYKFKPSTHPKVREEQIKIMNDFCEKNNK